MERRLWRAAELLGQEAFDIGAIGREQRFAGVRSSQSAHAIRSRR